MVRNVPVNPMLPGMKLILMIGRVNDGEKLEIAKRWYEANKVMNDDERRTARLMLNNAEKLVQLQKIWRD